MNLLGAGMVTAVGSSAPASCAAIRAKIAALEEVPYTDIRNSPIIGAPIRFIHSESKGIARLLDLALPALIECAALVPRGELLRTALLLGVADESRPRGFTDPAILLTQLQRRTGLTFSPNSRVVAAGAMSGAIALQTARRLFERRLADWCLVGGVDSFLDRPQLLWLQHEQRLKRPNNPDGFIPGEAACFVALGPSGTGAHSRVRVTGVSVEESQGESRPQPRATDLVAAMRGSLADARIPSNEVALAITDMTGERDIGVDHAIAVTRTFVEFQPKLHFWHPAMSIGAIGAATMPCAMALTWAAGTRGYAPGPHAMCISLTERFAKGAVVLAVEQG